MPDDPGDRDGRLTAAVAELYEAAPEDFTSRRGELAAAARDAGDRAAAKAIGALRRPTRAAWVVNRLARTDPGAPRRLADLAGALSAAQRAGDGPRLRELSAERWALIDALTAQALAAAGLADPPPSLRLEVTQTITAALGDRRVAADFAAGTLTKAAQWSGFGLAAADSGTADWVSSTTPLPEARPERPKTAARPDAARLRPATTAAQPSGTVQQPSAAARRSETTAERRAVRARQQAEEAQARAAAAQQAAADQAARRREEFQEAERALASASDAAAEAGSAEERLEAEVRDLEQRITRAREELAAARMRARRTEAAERRARLAVERLEQ